MPETLIKVENISKKFCRSLKKSLWYGMQDLGREITGRRHGGDGELRSEEFWAVKDVSFELKRGECLGLIGHNGAGKTTLLRMLNGLIKPDAGRIEMRGRVGALIALGAGFNPILTGRENIYVNASVIGLRKREVDEKIDEIIDFSEIREFIDAPLQSYSSGMQVRLGFAVASTLKPDVLLLDEVLAVGDVGFQIKCGHRIREIAEDSVVIFVSHNMQYVSLFCTRAILMGHGAACIDSNVPAEAIQQYYGLSSCSEDKTGTGQATVHAVNLMREPGRKDEKLPIVNQGEPIEVKIEAVVDDSVTKGAVCRVSILDPALNGIITYPVVDDAGADFVFSPGHHNIRLDLGPVDLNLGKYSFLVAFLEKGTGYVLLRHQGLAPFRVHSSNMNSTSRIIRPVKIVS